MLDTWRGLVARLGGGCVLLVVVFLSGSALKAQTSGTGALTGTVTDPSGAAIANATVTVISGTGQQRVVNTGETGSYQVPLLPPGNYQVRFSANGFKTSEVPSVTISVTETPI